MSSYQPNPDAIAQVAYQAGFRGNALVTAVAVAGAESDFGGNRGPSPTNDNGDWQINTVAHPQYNPSRLISDDLYNAQAAYAVSGGGSNWAPWTTYTSGRYQQYLSQAQAAVAKLGAQASATAAAAVRAVFPLSPGYTETQGYVAGGHQGVDLSAPLGTPIYAAESGTIASVGGDPTGFGNDYPVETLSDGTRLTYGHAEKSFVTPGQSVVAGQIIALLGSEGDSTGPHLHFQVNLPGGASTDPLAWLAGQSASADPTSAPAGSTATATNAADITAAPAGLLSSLTSPFATLAKQLFFILIKGVFVGAGGLLIVLGVASSAGKSTSLPPIIPV